MQSAAEKAAEVTAKRRQQEIVRKRLARGLTEDGLPKPVPNDGRAPDGRQVGRYPAPLSLSPAAKKQRATQQKRDLHKLPSIQQRQGLGGRGGNNPVISRRDRRA